MTKDSKVQTFCDELSIIEDEELALFIQFLILQIPDYFFKIPASSSGKYHPTYALGEGGLVRHTKAAIEIAYSLLGLDQYRFLDNDSIIAALLLHDCMKWGVDGEAGHSIPEHPLLAANFVNDMAFKYMGKYRLSSERIKQLSIQSNNIQRLIKSHMGEWNENYLLPTPKEEDEKFVHMCDFLASRKFIEVVNE